MLAVVDHEVLKTMRISLVPGERVTVVLDTADHCVLIQGAVIMRSVFVKPAPASYSRRISATTTASMVIVYPLERMG